MNLYRKSSNKILGGVFAGISKEHNIDLNLLRIVGAIIFTFTPPTFVVYIILWAVLKDEDSDGNIFTDITDIANYLKVNGPKYKESSLFKEKGIIIGISLIIIAFLLILTFTPLVKVLFIILRIIIPIVLLVIGIYIIYIFNQNKNR